MPPRRVAFPPLRSGEGGPRLAWARLGAELEAFRKTGVITLTAAGESVQPPAAPKSMVRKFLGACK
ncbi:MAG TPA: hypothetical protein VM471_08145 [Phenylobacterium sp.]|nr:hypothetical protein [Phenylobacterium sp.]